MASSIREIETDDIICTKIPNKISVVICKLFLSNTYILYVYNNKLRIIVSHIYDKNWQSHFVKFN